MIQSFKHKGLKDLFETGNSRGVNPQWKNRLNLRLSVLDLAQSLEEIELSSFRLHELKGERIGYWAISVTGNYRMTFRPQTNDGEEEAFDVWDVDLKDYH